MQDTSKVFNKKEEILDEAILVFTLGNEKVNNQSVAVARKKKRGLSTTKVSDSYFSCLRKMKS